MIASRGHSLVVGAPLSTFAATEQLLTSADFWTQHLLPTWGCALFALSISFGVGTLLGLIAGRSEFIRGLLDPMSWLLLSVPAVVVVVLGMLWLGLGVGMVCTVTSVLLLPTSYVTCVDAVRSVPQAWLDVATVYRFSVVTRYRYVLLPAIRGVLLSGLSLLAGNSLRVTVLCEVLGTDAGLGYELAAARSALDTPKLWGVCIVCVLVVGITEQALRHTVQRVLQRSSAEESAA